MSDTEENRSSDGWIGDPNILLAQKMGEASRSRFSGFHSFNLTRRIFLANFIALAVLLIGAILLGQPNNQFSSIAKDYMRDHAKFQQREIETVLARSVGETNFALLENAKKEMIFQDGLTIELYTAEQDLVSRVEAKIYQDDTENLETQTSTTTLWETVSRIFGQRGAVPDTEVLSAFSKQLISAAGRDDGQPLQTVLNSGDTIFGIARPLNMNNAVVGYVVIHTPEKLVSGLSGVRSKALFAFFFLAMGVALIFAAILARAITSPLNDLARAAEIGKTADLGYDDAHKALIPNLAGRTDVIGRLSGAMSDMTSALYERIATNESFAADVAHEIKNPLASMRSAVETLRVAKEGPGKTELLDILEMDVRRLDRLVSDISNASRLDAELVGEETERFELTKMLSNIVEFHRMEADDVGIDLFWEGPSKPIHFDGLEERLAQVFVNLVTNAVSFCEKGDAIRVWCRLRGNRILAVVEDTGPGIPEGSLEEIFRRFYSQRPTDDFGNHSGLGLAISKQIVEAHGGTIWAENITKSDEEGAPILGARFVVGFPV